MMVWSLMLFVNVLFLLIACVGMALNRRNLIVLLLCVELIFLAANFNFILFSRMHADVHGQVMTLFVVMVAAAESAIAMALFVLMYRQYGSVDAAVLTNIRD